MRNIFDMDDEEYEEYLRKRDRGFKWMAVIMFVFFLFAAVFLIRYSR